MLLTVYTKIVPNFCSNKVSLYLPPRTHSILEVARQCLSHFFGHAVLKFSQDFPSVEANMLHIWRRTVREIIQTFFSINKHHFSVIFVYFTQSCLYYYTDNSAPYNIFASILVKSGNIINSVTLWPSKILQTCFRNRTAIFVIFKTSCMYDVCIYGKVRREKFNFNK